MVKKHIIDTLKRIKKMNSAEFAHFIDQVNDDTVDELCECIYNAINTDLRFSKTKKSSLKRHVKQNCSLHRLKCITNKKTPIFKRRKAMKQEGKGLPMLLASVVPFLIDLFTKK